VPPTMLRPNPIHHRMTMTDEEQSNTLNPYSATSETVHDGAVVVHRTSRRWVSLALLYGIAAVYGASQILWYNNLTADYLVGIFMALLLTHWAITDSRDRDSPMVPIVRLIYFVTCPLSTLIYLIATRGFRGIGWALLNAVGFYLSISVGYYSMYYLLYFTGAWHLMDPIFFEA